VFGLCLVGVGLRWASNIGIVCGRRQLAAAANDATAVIAAIVGPVSLNLILEFTHPLSESLAMSS
jgi:hypothetical protein